MTTTTTTNTRLETRMTELLKARTDRKDVLDLPRQLTQRQVNDYLAETVTLDQQIHAIRAASDALNAIDVDADTKWLGHLPTWRNTISTELLALPRHLRNRELLATQASLTFCLQLIDHGLGSGTLPIVDLSTTRIGQLMAESGYAVEGDGLRGPRGWRGSLPEVEARLKTLTADRAKAEQVLNNLLRTDAEQAQRDKESAAQRDVLNAMTIRGDADGTGLVALDEDGNVLPLDAMTPEQKAAFIRFEQVAYPPRERTAAPID